MTCECGCGGQLDPHHGRKKKRFLRFHHLRMLRPERVRIGRKKGIYRLAYAPWHPRAGDSSCVFEHILVAERAIRRFLPTGAVVHHVNDDGADNRSENLVILQNNSEHMALHRRRRILRAGGDPWTQAICSTCRIVKDNEAFYRRSRGGISTICRVCERERSQRRWIEQAQ